MANNKPIILVLEDDLNRIDKLVRFVNNEAKIIHTNTVLEFIELFEQHKTKICLLIFDHDLPIFDMPKNIDKETEQKLTKYYLNLCDINGHNGYDAAKLIAAYQNIPFLVWSLNDKGATNIATELKIKKYDGKCLKFINENMFEIRNFIGISISEWLVQNR